MAKAALAAGPTTAAKCAESEAPRAKSSGDKKKLILLVAPIVAVIGIGGGLWFTGILPNMLGMQHETKQHEEAGKPPTPIYVDLPEFVANLNSSPQRPSYVKLSARLEVLKQEDAERV